MYVRSLNSIGSRLSDYAYWSLHVLDQAGCNDETSRIARRQPLVLAIRLLPSYTLKMPILPAALLYNEVDPRSHTAPVAVVDNSRAFFIAPTDNTLTPLRLERLLVPLQRQSLYHHYVTASLRNSFKWFYVIVLSSLKQSRLRAEWTGLQPS